MPVTPFRSAVSISPPAFVIPAECSVIPVFGWILPCQHPVNPAGGLRSCRRRGGAATLTPRGHAAGVQLRRRRGDGLDLHDLIVVGQHRDTDDDRRWWSVDKRLRTASQDTYRSACGCSATYHGQQRCRTIRYVRGQPFSRLARACLNLPDDIAGNDGLSVRMTERRYPRRCGGDRWSRRCHCAVGNPPSTGRRVCCAGLVPWVPFADQTRA